MISGKWEQRKQKWDNLNNGWDLIFIEIEIVTSSVNFYFFFYSKENSTQNCGLYIRKNRFSTYFVQ